MSRTTGEILRESLLHFEMMHRHACGDVADQMVIDAICMRLSAGIEALSRLAPEIRDDLFGEDWPVMWGMRNRIAHGYLLVDAVVVRQTVNVDLPGIEQMIRSALN